MVYAICEKEKLSLCLNIIVCLFEYDGRLYLMYALEFILMCDQCKLIYRFLLGSVVCCVDTLVLENHFFVE